MPSIVATMVLPGRIFLLRPMLPASAFTRTAAPAFRRATGLRSVSGATGDAAAAMKETHPEYANINNRNDVAFSAISSCGGIKVTAATARNLLNEMMATHSLTEAAAQALGRTAVCALLMSNGMEEEQTVQITVNGGGLLGGAVAICNGAGEIRGFVGNPNVIAPSLRDAVGIKGTVQVVRNHPEWPRPYNGITAVISGEIDRDVGVYLAESEQRSCALAAAASIGGVLCRAAGGYLVEQLPGCDEKSAAKVQENLQALVGSGNDDVPANLLLTGMEPTDIADAILKGMGPRPLGQVRPANVCVCSEERLLRSIRLIPRVEIEGLLMEHEIFEAKCEFCGKSYRMGPDEVRDKLAKATGDPSRQVDI